MPPLYPLPATHPLAAILIAVALAICAAPELGRLLTRRHRDGAVVRDSGSLLVLLGLLALSILAAWITAFLALGAAMIHGRAFIFGLASR